MTIRNLKTTFSAAAFFVAAASLAGPAIAEADSQAAKASNGVMHVAKDPTCGCCSAWVALARTEGYAVETTDTTDVVAAKTAVNMPGALWSCHTAMIDGYVVEGHVPFAALDTLLRERPDIVGISVPGMPAGSPGMGDDPRARFDVIAFGGSAGTGEVFFESGR